MKATTLLTTLLVLLFSTFGHAANLGEACESTDICEPESSVICEDNVCKCRERFHEDSGQCIAALGNDCAMVADECAKIPYALCDETDGICKCIRGYKPIQGDFPSALRKEKIHCAATNIGDYCLEPQQCQLPYSQFDGERCACKPGYVPDNKDEGCLKNATHLGDTCENSAQCSAVDPNTICKGPNEPKKCACKQNYFVGDAFDEECLPAARKYGEPCQSLKECTLRLGVDAQCSTTERVCVCVDGLLPSLDKSKCLPRRVLNDFCIQDQQCNEDTPNSECDADFKCSCVREYEEVKSKCYPIPHIVGDSCVETSQCVTHITSENIECSNGFCQCTPGYTPNAEFNQCLPGLFSIGSPCSVNSQCSENIENSLCDVLTRRCLCKQDFVPSTDNFRCLPRIGGMYDECVDPGQCLAEISGEVDCINGICDCRANCHFLESACWKTKRLQDTCMDSRECRLAEFSHRAECNTSGFCACKTNFTSDLVANRCNSGSYIVATFAFPAFLLTLLKCLI